MIDSTKILQQEIILTKIGEIADQLRIPTYVIGGFVRDLLLKFNKETIFFVKKDIDITCERDCEKLATVLAESFPEPPKLVVYKKFGTVMLKHQQYQIEFVNTRKESYQKQSRNPIVVLSSLEDDQKRRDFTINSIAIQLNKKYFGKIIDPLGGIKDLKNHVLKTPLDPDITFFDDPLRMFRAVRFVATLYNPKKPKEVFTIYPEHFKAIQNNKERIQILSKERIHIELNKILASPQPSQGLYLLDKSGLLQLILPEVCDLKDTLHINHQTHKNNFVHTLQVVDNVAKKSSNLWLRWAALLHDIAKPITRQYNEKIGFSFHGHELLGQKIAKDIFRRLKLPAHKFLGYVQKLIKLHLRPIALIQSSVTDTGIRKLIVEAGEDLKDLMLLCKADITSKNDEKVERYIQNLEIVEKKVQELIKKDHKRNFQPVITGETIMQTFQLKPSKLIGEIKEELKTAILEGKIENNYEEVYNYMLEIGKQKLNESP